MSYKHETLLPFQFKSDKEEPKVKKGPPIPKIEREEMDRIIRNDQAQIIAREGRYMP